MSMASYFKENLVKDYAQLDGITQQEARRRIEDVFNLITDKIAQLKDGEVVKLSQFFNFYVKTRKEKPGINPITGEPMTIPATKTIVVKPSHTVKKKVKG